VQITGIHTNAKVDKKIQKNMGEEDSEDLPQFL
jgi:hypothetical protein